MELENRSWLNYTNFVNIFLSFQWKQYRKLIIHPRYQSPNQNYANKIFPHQRSLEPKPSICRRYHLLNYRLCLSSIHPPEKPLHIQNYELPFISIIKSNDQVNTNRKLKFLLNKIPKNLHFYSRNHYHLLMLPRSITKEDESEEVNQSRKRYNAANLCIESTCGRTGRLICQDFHKIFFPLFWIVVNSKFTF